MLKRTITGFFITVTVYVVLYFSQVPNLLPGHGGILDRFDSHIFAIAFTLSFCGIVGGFIL